MLLENTPRPSNGIPSSSRTLLCAPSAPTRYFPRSATLLADARRHARDGHAVGILRRRRPPRGRPAPSRRPPRRAAQDRLQTGLRDEQPPAGAERIDALVQARTDVGELLAGNESMMTIAPSGVNSLARLLRHLVLDPGGAEHFERADVEECGPRQLRSAAHRSTPARRSRAGPGTPPPTSRRARRPRSGPIITSRALSAPMTYPPSENYWEGCYCSA